MIVENDGKVDRVDFAKRLYHWMQHGYEELGDIGGYCVCVTVCGGYDCVCVYMYMCEVCGWVGDRCDVW